MNELQHILENLELQESLNPAGNKVLIALHNRASYTAVIGRLQQYGLKVEELLGSTIVGHASVEALGRIRQDPDVRGVEISQRLQAHH
jgi:hypothetical protein